MSDDLLAKPKLKSKSIDLDKRQRLISFTGWLFFFLTLMALVLQNAIYAAKPKQILGAVDGKVVGYVVFDEPRARPMTTVMSDIKRVIMRCNSFEKATIVQDAVECTNHLSQELSALQMQSWADSGHIRLVSSDGCKKVLYRFDEEKSYIKKSSDADYVVSGRIELKLRCDSLTEWRNLKIDVVAQLLPKTTNKPYGLELTTYQDAK